MGYWLGVITLYIVIKQHKTLEPWVFTIIYVAFMAMWKHFYL